MYSCRYRPRSWSSPGIGPWRASRCWPGWPDRMPSMNFTLPKRSGGTPRRQRRGMFLLPSLITVGNMFCGYACVMYAMRGDVAVAAPFIGIAVVLDMLDGRIARMTGTNSEFGLQLDSLADVISFGLAPAVLAFSWGLSD